MHLISSQSALNAKHHSLFVSTQHTLPWPDFAHLDSHVDVKFLVSILVEFACAVQENISDEAKGEIVNFYIDYCQLAFQ